MKHPMHSLLLSLPFQLHPACLKPPTPGLPILHSIFGQWTIFCSHNRANGPQAAIPWLRNCLSSSLYAHATIYFAIQERYGCVERRMTVWCRIGRLPRLSTEFPSRYKSTKNHFPTGELSQVHLEQTQGVHTPQQGTQSWGGN